MDIGKLFMLHALCGLWSCKNKDLLHFLARSHKRHNKPQLWLFVS